MVTELITTLISVLMLILLICQRRKTAMAEARIEMLENEINVKQKVNESLNNEVSRLNRQVKKLKQGPSIPAALSDDVNRCMEQ